MTVNKPESQKELSLEKQVEVLQEQMSEIKRLIETLVPGEIQAVSERELPSDHIEFGSDRHARMLGLERDETSEHGWKLLDPTMFGPTARPEYIKQVLLGKISELNNPPREIQSDSPFEPHYKQRMWVPTPEFN